MTRLHSAGGQPAGRRHAQHRRAGQRAGRAPPDFEQLAAANARLQAELRHVTIQRDILKNAWAVDSAAPAPCGQHSVLSVSLRSTGGQTSPHRHAMIRTMSSHPGNIHIIAAMCQTLEGSRSGYHEHTHQARRPRRQQDQAIALRLVTSFKLSRQTYGSPRLRAVLQAQGLGVSRRGNCYDNAAMVAKPRCESCWATLKTKAFGTRAAAFTMFFDYTTTFYNSKRRHSSLGYMSPLDFEASLN